MTPITPPPTTAQRLQAEYDAVTPPGMRTHYGYTAWLVSRIERLEAENAMLRQPAGGGE